ncbi:MAG: hypothetical protein ACXWJA_03365 [Caldimonas sp.]
MYLVAIAWIYVVVLMALAEATSPDGTWLGAGVTLVFYGALPLGIALYLLGAPARRSARRRAEAASAAAAGAIDPDRGGHPAGDPVAAEGKEP